MSLFDDIRSGFYTVNGKPKNAAERKAYATKVADMNEKLREALHREFGTSDETNGTDMDQAFKSGIEHGPQEVYMIYAGLLSGDSFMEDVLDTSEFNFSS